ncbi:MAG TPA: hypothetical protein VGC56_10265 [Allosphingosinicella sp.]|jgi:hypothetical protein
MAQDDPAEGAAAPTEAAAAGASGRSSRNPQVFVLERELAEVHLLLDNVSANPATTVSERTVEAGGDGELPRDWLERICDITWPSQGTREERAEDAALLIRAKDHLNRLSYPASGFTIAFTTLVTQCNLKRELPGAALLRELANVQSADDKAAEAAAAAAASGAASPTRRSLAETAYPDLMIKARLFGRWMRGISWGLLFTLVAACLLSWYVAYGNAQLAELKTVNEAIAELDEAIANEEIGKEKNGATPAPVAHAAAAARPAAAAPPPAAGQNAAAGQSAASGQNGGADTGTSAADANGKLEPFTRFCDRVPYTNAVQAQTCAARQERLYDRDRVKRRLRQWISWPFSRCASPCGAQAGAAPPAPGTSDYQTDDAPAQASLRANIVGSAVLPFFYGLLGAAAAVIRTISKKIRTSLLSPRDLTLSLQQLALGAVTGACIGLFISSPGKAGGGAGLLDPVGLSGPAISFIAGFGVEAVFQALEELIKRIFNVNPNAAGPAAAMPARTMVVRGDRTPPPSPAPKPTPTPSPTPPKDPAEPEGGTAAT